MNGRAFIAVALATALVLAAGYAALGGGRYERPQTAEPCDPRPLPKRQTDEALAEWLTLSVLDGAACELGVSREALALAIASDQERHRFAELHKFDDDRIESALRAGVLRAIKDAERAEAIDATGARILRAAARLLPMESLIESLETRWGFDALTTPR